MLLQFTACALVAQQLEPVNPQTDIEEYEGYTIKLIPAQGGTYGYDIFNGLTLVVHQDMNPFTMEPTGLVEKLDAFKVAKWQILELKKENSGTPQPIPSEGIINSANGGVKYNLSIPRSIATELGIEINPYS